MSAKPRPPAGTMQAVTSPVRSPRRRATRARAAALPVLLALACAPPPPEAPPSWPDGTVLVVDGVEPITTADVDRWREAVLLAEPGRSEPAARRLSLTNIVLPQRVSRTLDRAAREESARQARETLAALSADLDLPATAPRPEYVAEGYWKFLGLDVWQLARHAPLGEWQAHETVGAHVVFRVLGRDPEPWNHLSRAEVERVILPWLDEAIAHEVVQQGVELASIEVLDPAWNEIVPARYLLPKSTPGD